jgi:hypothetical protein
MFKLRFQIKTLLSVVFCCLILISEGCASFTNEEFYDEWDFSTPTKNAATVLAKSKTPTRTITQVPITDTATPIATPIELSSLTIYSEELNPNWGLISGNDEEINLRAQAKSFDGFLSLAIIPTKSFSNVDFIVKEQTKQLYPLNRITGIRFWVFPEDYAIFPEDLGLEIQGSNRYPYYFKDDPSLTVIGSPGDSNTRLSAFGYRQPFPENTWTLVTVRWEDFSETLDFENIVGFSLINDSGFLQTIYLDLVELILANGESIPTRAPTATNTATPEPTHTATITPTPSATATPTKSQITPYWTPTPTSTRKPSRPDATKKPTSAPPP